MACRLCNPVRCLIFERSLNFAKFDWQPRFIYYTFLWYRHVSTKRTQIHTGRRAANTLIHRSLVYCMPYKLHAHNYMYGFAYSPPTLEARIAQTRERFGLLCVSVYCVHQPVVRRSKNRPRNMQTSATRPNEKKTQKTNAYTIQMQCVCALRASHTCTDSRHRIQHILCYP